MDRGGGGVYWRTDKHYKAAIAIAIAIANDTWNWLRGNGLITSDNLVQDGLNVIGRTDPPPGKPLSDGNR